eukprot:CAMPEP_0115164278 /NCGR_PEP_ID=MMETSP0227-20121206/72955_1 /TAXON_ID=89957 /ORGANISM="Polarella glacialis, Strain CCMP 1383" /LENGTH=272 /DNA_ID=CAMNT_0002576635 /DNA_START=32 /DNA_END=849 /DNA_ORIENTATION=-
MACCPAGAAPYLAADHVDEGQVGEVEGVQYYSSGSGDCGLLFLPDIWGWNGGRIRALADDFAKKGFSVWVPKLLVPFEEGTDGDGLPPVFSLAERGAILGPLFNGDWKAANVLPHVQKVVSAMKASGVKKFAVAGFCYGAWVGMYLARTMSAAAVTPHPSITIEGMVGGDPCALASESCCPWAMYPCGDPAAGGDKETYDREGDLFKALDTKFPGKIETKRFGKMQHGFVLRGAIKEGQLGVGGDDVKAAIQECVEDMAQFFEKHGLTPAKL